ncbi:HNH endonuclease signature motif containing protein [Pseudomonas sp. CGJS7]|uniref:HNH endonuclease signature motif containing protein n=1 Tax=Pseudomonas sp. CGJS7 TaxID=3109348 RepID=UPI00300B2C73
MVAKRIFRSDESFDAEGITRSMIPAFLESRGFTAISDEQRSFGKTVQQIIRARNPSGELIAAHVRLCWHREKGNHKQQRYSATQLLSKIRDGNWIESLEAKVRRDRAKGATHTLVVQREGDRISDAVLIPLAQLVEAWAAQRDLSAALIAEGRFRHKRKNHAMNGSSPTLWLHDEQAPELRNVLRTRPGVVDLMEERPAGGHPASDDTFDDLLGIDAALLGNDGAVRIQVVRSYVKRDEKVRAAVIARARGSCEREGCGASRDFRGFLDVHHILGVDKSDRVWTCVALCPNCHREAHLSPQATKINEQLSTFASQFKGTGGRAESPR